jgi:hypothetical protein
MSYAEVDQRNRTWGEYIPLRFNLASSLHLSACISHFLMDDALFAGIGEHKLHLCYASVNIRWGSLLQPVGAGHSSQDLACVAWRDPARPALIAAG